MDLSKYFPFKEFRPNQQRAIETIIEAYESGRNFFVLESPTGVGKSVVGYTVAKYMLGTGKISNMNSPPVVICTATRQLQNQYINTFNDVEYIWSARNYKCAMKPDDEDLYYGAGACLGKKKCKKSDECEYLIQKEKFSRSQIGVTNYHYFLTSCEFRPEFVIFDEAHNLENILCNIVSLNFSKFAYIGLFNAINKSSGKANQIDVEGWVSKLEKLLSNSEEEIEDGLLRNYCEDIYPQIKQLTGNLKSELDTIKSGYEDEPTSADEFFYWDSTINRLGKSLNRLQNFQDRLDGFLSSKTQWVVSKADPRRCELSVKPLEIREQIGEIIANKNRKILFMSATICGPQQYTSQLGLDQDSWDYLETPSIIPVKNRQVYNINIGSMNYRNKAEMLPKFAKVIDDIIDRLTNNWQNPMRGIIHSVSYDNARSVKELSKYRDKILIPDKDDLLDLNEYLALKGDVILASPSITEGVDLVDDLSRFQIFLKVPYGFLGDRWIKTKMNLDSRWYAREAIVQMVQGSGRSVRSMEDWAYTFILDSNFNRLVTQNRDLFPKWFLEAITNINWNG